MDKKVAVQLKFNPPMAFSVMKTLIVDDEPIARRVLREELDLFPEIEIVGEAENGREAIQKIADLQPDLVFLDLQMPVMGGFEVARNLRGSRLPVIVIVTAYDQHAIHNFPFEARSSFTPVTARVSFVTRLPFPQLPAELARELSRCTDTSLVWDSYPLVIFALGAPRRFANFIR